MVTLGITVLRLRSLLTTATPGMLSPVLSPLTMVPPLAVVSPLTPLTMVPPLTPPLAVVPPLARPGPGDWDLLEPALVTDLRDLALVTLLQVEILHQGSSLLLRKAPVISPPVQLGVGDVPGVGQQRPGPSHLVAQPGLLAQHLLQARQHRAVRTPLLSQPCCY